MYPLFNEALKKEVRATMQRKQCADCMYYRVASAIARAMKMAAAALAVAAALLR